MFSTTFLFHLHFIFSFLFPKFLLSASFLSQLSHIQCLAFFYMFLMLFSFFLSLFSSPIYLSQSLYLSVPTLSYSMPLFFFALSFPSFPFFLRLFTSLSPDFHSFNTSLSFIYFFLLLLFLFFLFPLIFYHFFVSLSEYLFISYRTNLLYLRYIFSLKFSSLQRIFLSFSCRFFFFISFFISRCFSMFYTFSF